MLQALSDFFLLLSKDKKTISAKDLATFYNFITKKMPQIDQQYPSLTSDSLEISSILSSSTNGKKTKETKEPKDSKKIFVYFQKQILNLYNELIDFCYYSDIIIINNKYEQIIKKKIDEKIKNMMKNSQSKYDINSNNIISKKLKKEEMRNFLNFLIINDELNFSITAHDFVNFFNMENKKKNRNNTLQFVKFVKNLIKKYKSDRKNTKNKKRKKIITNNININNSSNNNNNTNTNNNTISHNNTNKTNNTSNKKNEIKKEKTEQFVNKNSVNKNILNDYKILKKYNTEKKSNKEKEDDEDDDDDENDTLRCQTPKSLSSSENKKEFKKNIDNNDNNSGKLMAEKLSEDFKKMRKGKQSADKNIFKIKNRATVSSISYQNQKKDISSNGEYGDLSYNNSENKPFKRYSYFKNQKKNLFERNKVPIQSDSRLSVYHNSLALDKNIKRDIENKKFDINEGNVDEKEDSNIIEKIKTIENKNDSKNNNKFRIKKKIEHITDDFSDINHSCVGYNVVNFGFDKRNVKFKESYLFKNSEVHQHMVIYNSNEEDEKIPNDSFDENVGCDIF